MWLAVHYGMIIVASMAVGAALMFWRFWGEVKELQASNDRHTRALEAADEINSELRALLAEHEDAAVLVQDLTRQLERTTWEREDFARRAEEHRRSIAGILQERDTAWKLYDEQAIGHGNAQVLMMSGIAYLHQELAKRGVNIEMPSIIRETHEQYVEGHVTPVLARNGTLPVQLDVPGPTGSTERA
jgi:hypothetical protein